MNFSALARIPFQAVLAVCDALVESDAKRQARMLSRMYPDMDALNEVEAAIEHHEPNAPYLSWGTKPLEDPLERGWQEIQRIQERSGLHTYCNGCGSGYTGEHNCLRDLSPTPEGGNPGEVEPPPLAPSPGVDPSGANGSIPPGAAPGEGPSDSAIPPAPEGHPNPGGYTAPEVFAPEYVPTSTLLHSAADAVSNLAGCLNGSKRPEWAVKFADELRERADMFKAVEDVPK